MRKGIAVDAWCSSNPGPGGYRGIDLETGKEVFNWSTNLTTNNLVEFVALVHGMKWIKEKGLSYSVWTDSTTAMSWAKNRACKTKFDLNKNKELKERVSESLDYLKVNKPANVIKWDTKKYGEIPADFGRK